MVRRGVGVVVVALVALAGCGSSDKEQVAAVAKDLESVTEHHDGVKLCRDVLHPNTVRAVERMARFEAVPGGPRPSCEQKYRTSRARSQTIDGRDPTADDVTIKGDVAYMPAGETKRPFARRDGDKWKIDFTADPEIRWGMQASLACARFQDRLQAMPLPPANREGIVADLRATASAMTTFRRELDAPAALGEAKTPAGDLASALDRMRLRLESTAASVERGRSLDAAISQASKVTRAEAAEILRTTGAAGVQCGRIPSLAPDGADFRREANAVCQPVARGIEDLADPSTSATAALRYLRHASALERRASRALAGLTPPADLDRVYRDTLSTLSGLGATLRAEGAAVARRDLAGARRVVGRLSTLDYRKSAGFRRLGLAACAGL
jgi:hypothetical protein